MKRLSLTDISILELVVDGDTMKEISHKVFMNIRTIESHIMKLRREYEAKNTVHLIAILLLNKLLLINKNTDKLDEREESAHDLRTRLMMDLRKNINKLMNTYQDNL